MAVMVAYVSAPLMAPKMYTSFCARGKIWWGAITTNTSTAPRAAGLSERWEQRRRGRDVSGSSSQAPARDHVGRGWTEIAVGSAASPHAAGVPRGTAEPEHGAAEGQCSSRHAEAAEEAGRRHKKTL